MAATHTPAATTSPKAPKAPEAKAPEAPKANGTPATEAKKPEADGKVLTLAEKKAAIRVRHKTPQAAQAEADSRAKGAKEVYRIVMGDEEFYSVAASREQISLVLFEDLGHKIESVKGPKTASAPRKLGPDAVLELLNSMSEADRAKLLAQIKS